MFKKVFFLSLFVLNLSANDITETISHNGFSYNVITSPITGKKWLDRNVGASEVCTKSRKEFNTDEEYISSQEACFGDYYQWGRLTDGHEKSDSGTTDVLATDISNAGVDFITNRTFEWASTIDKEGFLRTLQWLKSDGTSVCPIGFRVPTSDEVLAETSQYNGVNDENKGAVKVTNIDSAFKNFLKLPVSGYRRGEFNHEKGNSGSIWSNSIIPPAYFFSNHYGGSTMLNYSSNYANTVDANRSLASPVRCIKHDNLNSLPELGNFYESRNSSTITIDEGVVRSTADGTNTFGISKEINGLEVGKKYKVSFSFKTGTSINSYGRISEDLNGYSNFYTLFTNINTDKNSDFTFTATNATMYVIFLSTTDNAYIEVKNINISTSKENINPWMEARNSSTITTIEDKIRSTADGTDTFGMIKKLPDLEVGKEYKLSYSFLTKNSTNSYGRISIDSQGKDISYSLFHNIDKDKEATFTFTATQRRMYMAFLSTTDNANIEVEYADLTIEENADTWTEPRNSSTITSVGDNTRSTADGTDTFGMVKKLTNLVVGEKYKFSYSFLTGESINSYGRISEDREGHINKYTLFTNINEDKKETLTFSPTKSTMYIAFLSTTDNAYIEVEYVNLEENDEKDIPTTVSHNGFTYNVVTSPYTGRSWLDRNLGAIEVCSESRNSFPNKREYFESQKDCYGDFYQWGRLTDGHEKIDSGITYIKAKNITDAGVDFIKVTYASDLNYFEYTDWTEIDETGKLRIAQWSKSDGSSICPIGFRVPTIDELYKETKGLLNHNNINKHFLKLPLSAFRDSSYYSPITGHIGSLWSTSVESSVFGTYSSIALEYNTDGEEWKSMFAKEVSLSVRCIKD